MRALFIIPSAALSGRAADFLKLANTAPEMRGATMTVKKENPGGWHATGAEGLGIWIDSHDLPQFGDRLQVIL